MQFLVKSGNPEKQRAACAVLGIWSKRRLSVAAEAVDRASDGAISAVVGAGDMDGKAGQTLMVHRPGGAPAERLLLVGLGKESDFDESTYRKAIEAAAKALKACGASDAVNYLPRCEVAGKDVRWKIQQAVIASRSQFYRFDQCRGAAAKKTLKAPKLKKLSFDVARRADLPKAEAGLKEGLAIAAGQDLARDLGNTPGNLCTPSDLANTARKMARGKASPLKVKVLEEADMKKLGMGSLLSVSRGSSEPAKLIAIEYMRGKKGDKPVALVGKGLTFDAGGISLKPAPAMDEMKFDMCGGAAVIGAMKALAELKLPINVVGVVAASENLPDGKANKPGDVVTSMAGITIEILNTDAEGRLILCDALTWTEQTYQPAVCIDMATLTGACIVALGSYPHGLMSNTPELANALRDAGNEVGDRVWELPLWPEYDDHLRSPCADVANIATKSPRDGGAIIAATFLHRFTKNMNWAHLDIAGTAWTGKLATGRPVPLLIEYLKSRAG